jgi:hypothetical protein
MAPTTLRVLIMDKLGEIVRGLDLRRDKLLGFVADMGHNQGVQSREDARKASDQLSILLMIIPRTGTHFGLKQRVATAR